MAVPEETGVGYWKYMVVLGAAIVNFLNTGTGKSFGVLMTDLRREFDTGVSILGFGIGMCHGVAVGLTFASRPLLTKTTCQVLTVIGGIVSGLGFCLCSASINAMMFVSGIAMAGIGYSFMIISNIVIVKDYFPTTYAIAVSFSFSGGAVGMMLIPVITEKLQIIYGWRGALLLIAGINMHNVVAGALFRPLPSNRRCQSGYVSRSSNDVPGEHGETSACTTENTTSESSKNYNERLENNSGGATTSANESEQSGLQNREAQTDTQPWHGTGHLTDLRARPNDNQYSEPSSVTSESDDLSEEGQLISQKGARARRNDRKNNLEFPHQDDQSGNDRGLRFNVVDLFDLRLMYDYPALNMVVIGGLLAGATTTGWVAFLVPDGQEKGYQLDMAVLLATIGGSGNIIGRFCIGYMINSRITARGLFIASNIVCGVAFCLNSVASNFWGLSILATVNGLTLGAMLVLICLMVEEIAEDSRFASGVALAYFFLGVGEIVGGLFAGWLYDITQTYNATFFALGSLNFLGALLTIISHSSCFRRS